ncbi:hypothetical protein [Algibacter lectus]|uniref:hypothetical protein n=1 Tax=Algibacter lectus TaxID=221126 RepID=UPI0026EF9169|nr:hypothetical protein [Algibacter lectus]MDO7138926.1 hypothetical protein [Algibacter lectus]
MSNTKITFKPSAKSIAFGVVGTLFFGVFAFKMLSLTWTVSEGTNEIVGYVILWIMTFIFLFFAISTLIWLLNTQIIQISKNELRISKPLIFLHKSIYIKDIKRVYQKDYKIKSAHDHKIINIYDGFKTIIVLKNNKEISINSFDTTDYNAFNKKIKQRISYYKEKNTETKEVSTLDKWNGISWLIFTIVTTIIVIWAFLIK